MGYDPIRRPAQSPDVPLVRSPSPMRGVSIVDAASSRAAKIYLIAVRAVNGNPCAHQRSPGACDAFLPLLLHGHEALQHVATFINVASFAMNNPVQADRILRLRTVLNRTGLRRSTLYRKVAEGSLPRQIAISRRCVGWRASDLDAWLRNPMFFHVDDR